MVLRPTFPQDESERLRRELLANLDDLRDDDSGLLHRFFARALYGDTPYGRAVAGTEESTMALNLPGAQAWHRHHLVTGNLVTGAAGAISGSAEVVNMQPPDALLKRGITALPCIGDGRQSGTSASPSILNASPEAAVGGGLALLQTGDIVRVDLKARRVDALVSDAEWQRRRSASDF